MTPEDFRILAKNPITYNGRVYDHMRMTRFCAESQGESYRVSITLVPARVNSEGVTVELPPGVPLPEGVQWANHYEVTDVQAPPGTYGEWWDAAAIATGLLTQMQIVKSARLMGRAAGCVAPEVAPEPEPENPA